MTTHGMYRINWHALTRPRRTIEMLPSVGADTEPMRWPVPRAALCIALVASVVNLSILLATFEPLLMWFLSATLPSVWLLRFFGRLLPVVGLVAVCFWLVAPNWIARRHLGRIRDRLGEGPASAARAWSAAWWIVPAIGWAVLLSASTLGACVLAYTQFGKLGPWISQTVDGVLMLVYAVGWLIGFVLIAVGRCLPAVFIRMASRRWT